MRRRVYCRYEGENGQRPLEGFRLNMASRTDWAMRGGGGGEKRGDQAKRTKKADLCRNQELGEEMRSPWEGLCRV